MTKNNLMLKVASLEMLHSKTMKKQEVMLKFIENIEFESLHGSSKVAIEISALEEIASQFSQLNSLESEKSLLISCISSISQSFFLNFAKTKKLKSEIAETKQKFKQQVSDFRSDFKRISSVLKEYKEKCKNTLLYYLKTLDHDLRKILKPLVPTSVLNEQIKYPNINKNPSLLSSFTNSLTNSSKNLKEPVNIEDPSAKEVVPENNDGKSHVELLIKTLEKVAKDLITILSDANCQYYDTLNNKKDSSHPPTPLAAPLPEYFVYETEESDLPAFNKIIIKEEAQSWIKRFTEIYKKKIISSQIYSTLIDKVNPLKLRGCKIDLQDIFKDLDFSADFKESITFALVNKCSIQQHDVTLSDLLTTDEKKIKKSIKPEPPKSPNPNFSRQRGVANKIQKKSLDMEKPEFDSNIFASVDYQNDLEFYRQSPIPRNKISTVRDKSKNRKSYLIEKNEKHIRVRSVTPVYSLKEKTSGKGKFKYSKKV